MIIKSIKLVNFRNHSAYELKCEDNTSLILGPNGSGKTSVLEAIYILTRGKSFRATDKDILKHNEEFYRAEIEFEKGEKSAVVYDGQTKIFQIEDKKSRRLPKKSRYPVILFLPSDLNLISHAPSRRRDYFDNIFSQLNNNYSDAISKYNKALKQRNELLKQENLNPVDLFSWNVILAKYGSYIHQTRQEYINKINLNLTEVYRSIAKNQDTVKIIYQSEAIDDETKYLKTIEQNYQKDFYLGHTSFGVHRDDYLFKFNQNLADGSASRGESRSIILALKFIEADLIYQTTHQKPLILLDDVFSELDQIRRSCLIKNFQNHQVIITSVEAEPNILP